MTLADGSTRTFTSAEAASVRQTLAGQASLYAQTAPPSGSYVLDAGTRAKIIAGSSPDAPATRRGLMKFAEKFSLRKPFGLFGAVPLLVGANVAVWTHNAGVVADHFGWFQGRGGTSNTSPLGTVTTVNLRPVSKGDVLGCGVFTGYDACSTYQFTAPADGYVLSYKASNGGTLYGEQATDRSACTASPITPGLAAAAPGVEYLSGPPITCRSPATGSPQGGTMRADVAFAKADPKPEATNPAAPAQTGAQPTSGSPSPQTLAQFETLRQAQLDGPLSADQGTALLEAVSQAGLGDSPLVVHVNVPSCAGDLYTACAAKITSAGLSPTRVKLSAAAADLDHPANYVTTLSPVAPTTVENGSTVTVTTNPDTDVMPLSVPAPNTGETFTEYKLRLTTLGHLGTAVEEVVLTDATLDPTKGPSAVTETIPTTGTRLLVDTNIKVRVNPTTAPTIGGSGGGMPDIPTINFDPLLQAGTCAQFPFGVPCWVYATVEHFVGSPETPEVSFHFPYGGSGNNTTLSMEMFDPYMGTIRTLIGIGIMGSMLWLFYGLAFGGAIGGGRDDGSR